MLTNWLLNSKRFYLHEDYELAGGKVLPNFNFGIRIHFCIR